LLLFFVLFVSTADGIISFIRYSKPSIEETLLSTLATSTTPVMSVDVRNNGTIEDDGVGTLQIDFANKYLGTK
jgi:hypothetical protein